MSSLFDVLSVRARGADLPAVRPRVPGRFEAAAAVPETTSLHSISVESPAPARARASDPAAVAPVPAVAHAPTEGSSFATPQAVFPTPLPPAAAMPSRVAAMTFDETPTPTTMHVSPAPAVVTPPIPPSRDTIAVEPKAQLLHARRAEIVDPPARAVRPAKEATAQPETPPLRRAPVTAAASPSAAIQPPRPPPAIVPRVVRQPERQLTPPPSRIEETTVHVSIGRIEVRAVPPPETRRRESKSGVMTLDDYLRSRRAPR